MRALLLSAGLGTRLRPLTDTVPKCLVTIDGMPLLEHWLRHLVAGGVQPILVNTHYLAAQVAAFVRGSRLLPYVTLVHEQSLLGTGGTLLRNRDFFQNDPVMLIHGDNLSLFDVSAFMAAYENRAPSVEITMMTFTTSTPQTCGIVKLDEKGIVCGFYEKVGNPPGNLANGAVYILSPAVLAFLKELGKEIIDFSTEVIPQYLGRINTFHNDVYHRDIGTPESLAAARLEYPEIRKRFEAAEGKVV